jgi:site-specific DNA recombinase
MKPDGTGDYALYLRKSRGRAGISRQRSTTTAYIERQDGHVAAEFADADRTAFRKIGGHRPERESFDAMLAWLAGHPGASLAAWHADRLLRDPEDTERLIKACIAGGHLVHTPRGGTYDLPTATGRKRLRDDANMAAYEVDHMTERIMAAKAEAIAEGRDLGGRRRFGWDAGLHLIPAEASTIALGTRQIIAGVSLGAVTREWNAAGVKTSTGKPWRTREVSRVLRRARNAGLLEHHGQVAGPGTWPAIVTEAEWRACKAILEDPARRTSPGPERRWLLSGIALCGICGWPLLCTTGGRRVSRAVYRCRRGGLHVARDARNLDDWVSAVAVRRLSLPDAVPQDAGEDLVALQAEIIAIRQELDDLAADVGARRISARQMALASGPLNDELSALQQRAADAARPGVFAPFAAAADPWEAWDGLTLDQQRRVIATLMCVTVFPAPKGRPAGWCPGQPYFHRDSVRIDPVPL